MVIINYDWCVSTRASHHCDCFDPRGSTLKLIAIIAPMPTKILFILYLSGAVVLEIVADIFLKQWTIANKLPTLLIGLVIYALGTLLWALALRHQNLANAIVVFTIFNLIAVVLVGVYYFGEQISLTNKLGILLGIVSMILLEL